MDKQKRNRILWIFMVLMFIALGLMLNNMLHRTAHITLPAETGTEDPNTQGSSTNNGMLTVVEITPETVQAAIATLSRPQNYQRTVTVEQIWSSGSAKSDLNVAVCEGWTRIDRTLPNGEARHTLTDGDTTYIWYNEETKFYTGAAGEISADNEQMIPTYENILDLPADTIVTADYREYFGINCIYVETAENPQGYALRCWVSVDSGLLVAAERISGEACVYRMTALTLDTTTPLDTQFRLPDGTMVF